MGEKLTVSNQTTGVNLPREGVGLTKNDGLLQPTSFLEETASRGPDRTMGLVSGQGA